jgi:tetratricopeptide (TPR) repeat protein
VNIGHRLGFNPHPLFDIDYYRRQAGELGDENPLLHFLAYGKELQLSPHPLFDTKFYLKNNADARKSKLNPLLHFLRYGRAKQPHPLFDARFYLSEYADVKKSSINPLVHFVWRGARERRWPNASFDTLRYLKMILPASFDNPLIYYAETEQKQDVLENLPGGTQSKRNVLWTATSFVGFFLICLSYVLRRPKVSERKNYGHHFSITKFLLLTMSRFWHGCGSQVQFTSPLYLMQPQRMIEAEPFSPIWYKSPLTFAYLYLANVFKIQGFFGDAEIILRNLSQSTATYLALCSLGDLLLTQAIWADEFRQYEQAGIALNHSVISPDNDSFTWHKRTFSEALDILEQAIKLDDNGADAQWLLCYGYLAAGKYSQVLETINKYPGTAKESAERNLLKARATFAMNPEEGVAVRCQYLEGWIDNCNISVLNQVSVADLPDETVHENLRLIEPIKLQIESNVVHGGKLNSFKNTLDFSAAYLSRFKNAQIIPESGMLAVSDKLLVKESIHVKPYHIPLFSSYIQQINDDAAFLCAPKSVVFEKENCIYFGTNNNFYHWLLDELPRLSLIEQMSLCDSRPILINKNASAWQYELLSMLGIQQERLLAISLDQPTSFKNLIVPSRLSKDMVTHPQAAAYMRKKLFSGSDHTKPRTGKRIYITRNIEAKTNRAFLNEKNIIEKFKRNNFQIVDTGSLSIKRQIDLFHDVDVVAGPGGAGLANILFAPKGARLLSLSASDILCETFTSIAASNGQQSWWIAGLCYPKPYPYWLWTTFDYEIAEKDIDYCFERTL